MNTKDSKLTDDAITAIESGQLIQAIKITRAKTGLGLKESKDVVEAYIELHPELKAKILANKFSFNMPQERFIHILIAVGLVAIYLVFFRN